MPDYRITFAERPEVVIRDCNQVDFTGAGGVVFQRVTTASIPTEIVGQRRNVVTGVELLRGFSRDTMWVDVEPLDESENAAHARPLEEVFTP